MAGGITVGGLGSGLDTQAIIQALLNVERIPINQLEAKKAAAQKKIDLLGTFKTQVQALRDKAADLGNLSKFSSFKVTPSIESAATFSASGTAIAGSHSLLVQSLSQSDRWAFDAVADPAVALSPADGETVSFTANGTNYSVGLTAAASSLNDIAAAINTTAGADVTASVVNAGTTAAPSWKLVVASKESGKDFRISNLASTVTGLTIDGTGPAVDGSPLSRNNIVVGSNAVALVDGLTVERDDNDFSDVVEGVSIQLTEADPSTTVTFTVEPDKEAIKGRIQEFIDAYNSVRTFIKQQSTYDPEAGPGGALFGDSVLRTVQRTLNGALFNQTTAQVNADTLGYGTLRLVGIETNSDGTLKIDPTVFDDKIDANLDAFTDLFVDRDGFNNGGAAVGTPAYYVDTTTDSGLGATLSRAIDAVVKSYQSTGGSFSDGVFDARTKSINETIRSYTDQIARNEARVERLGDQLTARFAALESLMGQLQSQGQFLDQINK